MNIQKQNSDFPFHLKLPFFFSLHFSSGNTVDIFWLISSAQCPCFKRFFPLAFNNSEFPSRHLLGLSRSSISGSKEHPSPQRGEEQPSIWGVPGGSWERGNREGEIPSPWSTGTKTGNPFTYLGWLAQVWPLSEHFSRAKVKSNISY